MDSIMLLHAGCAAAYLIAAFLVVTRGKAGLIGAILAACCLTTAAWAGAEALMPRALPAIGLDLLRVLGWYGLALHLYRRSTATRPGSPLFKTIALVIGLAAAAALLTLFQGRTMPGLWLTPVVQLGIAVCTLLLIENLYRNTPDDRRWHINLFCVALTISSAYDIALAAYTELTGTVLQSLLDGRAVVFIMLVPLMVMTAQRNRTWSMAIHVKRTVVFHSATLVLSGVVLLSLAAIGELCRALEADWGSVAEISLIFTGLAAVGVLASSASVRSRLRGVLNEHFFADRYDYRAEWTKCLDTLSVSGVYAALHARAIRAVADVVDSPAGILLLREPGETTFRWAGSMNMPALTVPLAPDHPVFVRLTAENCVLECDGALEDVAADVWLAIGLVQDQSMLGLVLLAPPRSPFRLDREVFDLLRMVAREVAGHVAEQQASQVLLETRQFQEYAKRFAFVAHDIKNVSSQLGMVLSNAERHMQDPEFQQDVLTTVRSSVQRIGTLLRRLESRPEMERRTIMPIERLQILVVSMNRLGTTPIRLEQDSLGAAVPIDASGFDAAVTHLLTNAMDASPAGREIVVSVRHDPRCVIIDIVDQGPGMTETFVRDQLFQPFATSKHDGSGIGAYQARTLLRAAGGDLRAISVVGKGTTMQIVLPLAERAVLQGLPLSA